MTDRHIMTGPEHYLVTADRFQQDMRCDDCRAGKLGDRFTLAIKDGIGQLELACGTCGGLPGDLAEMDEVNFSMTPIPVTVTEWADCANPGGTHESGYCDHGWGIVITPRADTSDKETSS